MAARRRVLAVALAMLLWHAAPGAAQSRRTLTGGPALAAAYDAIVDARFGDVPRLLDAACGAGRQAGPGGRRGGPPAPERAPDEACQLLDIVALWWRIQIEPHDRSHDAAFTTRADTVIESMHAWTVREPERGEAWFYLGGAYGVRAQFRVQRGERLAAARDGKRIKEALERALALEPALADAWFGIGLYHYYADVAPAAAKMLRWLLALPGGDRKKGMQEMLRAREDGQLMAAEADYQLHLIHLWYEDQPERALDLLRGLRRTHPRNPLFPRLMADVQAAYLQDYAASLRTSRELLDAALANRVAEPVLSELHARLGAAAQLDRLHEADAALEQAQTVLDRRPAPPAWILARAHLVAGQAQDRLGRRPDALASYRAALAQAEGLDLEDVKNAARAGIRARPDAEAALAYRLSLDGWRALERGAIADAAAPLLRARTLRPDDPVIRYRHARLLDAQGRALEAIDGYEAVMIAGALTPPTIFAAASLDAARLYEREQAVPRAIELYRRALDTIGVDEGTRAAASRALTRLTRTATPSPSR